jgi:hypothetical protein
MSEKSVKIETDMSIPDNYWDYENGFFWYSSPNRLAKTIAHFELYKSIVNLPGVVLECGVFKGTSLIRFLTYRHILEATHSRSVFGFDMFGKFPRHDDADQNDIKFIEGFEGSAGDGLAINNLSKILDKKGISENLELIGGDITQTLPSFLEENPQLKIALLHIDVDVYDPTRVILEQCWDRIVSGGIIVLDDYATVAGETKAVDEFLKRHKGIKVEKLSISHIPSYIRKP